MTTKHYSVPSGLGNSKVSGLSNLSPSQKYNELIKLWRDDPLVAIHSLFGVIPDEQQTALILAASIPGSRICVKSCQGAGKTASLVWLCFYFLLTLPDCRILITSPSFQQLGRVFNTELIKWHMKMPEMFKDFFEITKERVFLKSNPTQAAHLVTAKAENQESLQGGHAENYIILADEASGIDEGVFDLLYGTLGTGSGGRFIMTSNPVRNSGRFYEIFDREINPWVLQTFHAAGSSQVKPEWIAEMAEFYGEDSDFYKIRVLAQFPRASEDQFIPVDYVEQAMESDLPKGSYANFEKVAGVDVARFGSDKTVLTLRQGPKLLDVTTFSGLDNMEVAARVLDYHRKWMPQRIFVDSIGVGAGVYDRCKQLGLPVVEVVVSTRSSDPKTYFNLRGQLWGEMRTWLSNGASIPKNDDLKSQLAAMTYAYNNKMQIQLSTKKDMKKRGLDSPDIADSIALTFAGNTFAYTPKMAMKRNVAKANYFWV